ncbi:MAG: hypothetical protein IIT98_05195 [Kiritimatiellae bacterium]|nr:hypothetical protein [Kiritimatiellia bacterium]
MIFAFPEKIKMCNYRLRGFCRRFAPEYIGQGEQRGDGSSPSSPTVAATGRRATQKQYLQNYRFTTISRPFFTILRKVKRRCISAADRRQKPSRTLGQMISNVWVNDPERLVKRSRRFFRKNKSLPPKPRASK